MAISKERKEKLLKEAKKRFPIGTNFDSIFGARDQVTQPKDWGSKDVYRVDEDGCVFVRGRYEYRMIKSEYNWVEPIEINEGTNVIFEHNNREMHGIVEKKGTAIVIVFSKYSGIRAKMSVKKLFAPNLMEVIRYELYH